MARAAGTHARSDVAGSGGSGPNLLLRTGGFTVLAVAGLAAIFATDAWWTALLAVLGLGIAVAGIVVSVLALAADEPVDGETAPGRATTAGLGVLAAVLLVLAVTLPDDAGAQLGHAATAPAAVATVRSFLAVSVLDDDAYLSCQYLTPAEQREAARIAGTVTCREAFTAIQPSFDGIGSVGALDDLPLRATVAHGRAVVTAAPRGARPATFALRPATAAERAAIGAPAAPCRNAAGVAAVLRG